MCFICYIWFNQMHSVGREGVVVVVKGFGTTPLPVESIHIVKINYCDCFNVKNKYIIYNRFL